MDEQNKTTEGVSMRASTGIKILATMLMAFASALQAVEDGLGTNHVRNLRVYNNIILDGQPIANWQEVAASTLTNNSISTAMIQNGAVTEDKLSASTAGDGLVGGAGSPLAVGAAVNGGITVNADSIQVDATVVRTTGAQSIDGVKTFTSSPVVPTPSGATDAANKSYVDSKISSSIANGTADHDTLRWDNTAGVWTNSAGLTVDASGNTAVAGTLGVTGAVTLANTTDSTNKDTGALIVEGGVGIEKNLSVGVNATVGGTLGVTGDTTLGNVTATGNMSIGGNVTLGDASGDSITFSGTANSDLAMGANKITGLAAPAADTDAANKLYVDNAINGLSWKQSVRAATTANGALASAFQNGATIDGVTLATGNRILIKNQSAAEANGIYIVQASGAPVRATDLNETAELAGAAVFVSEGTTNKGTAWVVTTPGITLGGADLLFAQFASPGTYSAGDGLNLNGLEFSVNATNIVGAGLEDDGNNNLRIAAGAAGDGLTGGGGSALAVDTGSGLEISGGKVVVDATVIRTTGAQSIDDVKTFTSSPVVPTPSAATDAANKSYVDSKISSSVASGTGANQTLRWDDTAAAWTNSTGLTVDASGNTAVAGTLGVTGAVTLANTTDSTNKDTGALIVEGGVGIEKNLSVGVNATVGGTLGVTGDTTLGNVTATGNMSIGGNVTLGDASGDSITFSGTANSDLAMGANKITGLAAPAADTDAANKLYVDNAINGLSWKQAVRVATTANGALASAFQNGATIDGVTLATGNRILIKNQSAAEANGIYIVQASGAPVRATDLNETAELAGAAVFVSEGTTNKGTAWVVTTPGITLGGADLLFAQFASPGTYSAGDGLNLNGLEFSVNATNIVGAGLEDDGNNNLRIAAGAAGDGLTGGGGSALAVDSTVVRTTGAQSIDGVKTFTSFPVTPSTAPATDYEMANKKYVDDKLSSSVANGTVANQTLRWDGSAWTNNANLTVDGTGNISAGGTLGVAGITTLSDTTTSTTTGTGALVVGGGAGIAENINVGGTATIAGAVTLNNTTASTDKDTGALIVQGGVGVEGNINAGGNVGATGTLTVGGNTTLGDAIGTDTLTVNAKTTLAGAVVVAPSGELQITAGAGITATHIQNSYLKVRGNSGAVDLTVNPQIAAGTAGQMLTLQGTDDINTIKLDDGTGLSLNSGISFTLKNGHIIQFIFDGTVWRETFRTVPAP
jgi:hypothetical protein